MIKINEKYVVDSDNLQYILKEKKTAKSDNKKSLGKDYYVTIGYYGSLESLANALLEKQIKANLTIIENINKIIKIKEEIMKFGKEI